MEPQTIFGQSLSQRPENTLRIPRVLAADHRIVRVAIEGDLPSTMCFDHLFKPRIEHVMSKDIGEYGAATTPLRPPSSLTVSSPAVRTPALHIRFTYRRKRSSWIFSRSMASRRL
jgi:hypothetical protein